MDTPKIYFDYNATSPLSTVAKEAWLTAQEKHWHNPASPYQAAQKARAHLEYCREQVASFWNVPAHEIVFTSGATEAANHLLHYLSTYTKGIIWRSGQEHSCVSSSMKRFFADRTSLLDLKNSTIEAPEFYQKIIGKKDIVVLQAANHETGVIHDWETWAAFCDERRIPFVCDQTQLIGKLPTRPLPRTTWAFASGHKFGAPKGVGVLRVPAEYSGFKGFVGGPHQQGYRAGTEDYPSSSALTAAWSEKNQWMKDGEILSQKILLRDQFIETILSNFPETFVAGSDTEHRLWNTVLLYLPVGNQLTWVNQLDKKGFCVSTGSACSTTSDLSPTLQTLGYTPEKIKKFIRISSGWTTTAEDWQGLAKAILSLQSEIESSASNDLTEVVSL